MLKSEGVVDVTEPRWFAVRCVFYHASLKTYEERITLWQAEHVDEAIAHAEQEALDYGAALNDVHYLRLAQGFSMFDEPKEGVEVFSLMRDSDMDPAAYIAHFFDTGKERQQQH